MSTRDFQRIDRVREGSVAQAIRIAHHPSCQGSFYEPGDTREGSVAEVVNLAIQRQQTIQTLGRHDVHGGLLPYLWDIVFLAIGTCIMVAPPFRLPVNDPSLGFLENLTYYWGYNPFGFSIYVCSSWQRLQHICSRKGMDLVTLEINPYTLSIAVIAIFFGCGLMALSGAIWDTNAAFSYSLIYTAPVALTLTDVAFIFVLPKEERTSKMVIFLTCYGVLGGLPLFLIFAPIAMKMLLPRIEAIVIPVVVFPALAAFLQWAVAKGLTRVMAIVQFDTPFSDTGFPLHLEATVAIAEMMLFPGAEDSLILITLVVVEAIQRILDNRKLRNALEADEGSYTRYSLTENTPLSASTSRFPVWSQNEAQKEATMELSANLNAEAYHEVEMLGIVHLTTLTMPLIFSFCSYCIVNMGNKQQYYLYQSFNEGEELTAIQYALIACGFEVVFFTIDLLYLQSERLAPVFLAVVQCQMVNHWKRIVSTLAWSCIVFTSCFFIKHDGIAVLQKLEA